MNRLRFETSPYLLQHAHNPVHWYSWKPEAFERAAMENKPILVSIGYSTCHWCHVMERESFEDPEVAAYMNTHFINIKVDREERPDIDHIYMQACQAISGGGGWPLNCFLTPDGRPFYAGTYYPPKPAFNRPSWVQLLKHLHELFVHEREKIDTQASRLTDIIQHSEQAFVQTLPVLETGDSPCQPETIHAIYRTLAPGFDTTYGGFGGAPKFPGTMSLQFLLEYHFHTGNQKALEHALFSVDCMLKGGIYDQVGGGFSRYTVDQAWVIPHFEKMLYDNALLVTLLSDLYKHTQQNSYKKAIVQTLDFVQRELFSPEGGFYSALDADSEGEEGKFYTWTWEALQTTLGDDANWYSQYAQAVPEGNWENTNILQRPSSDAAFAASHGFSEEELDVRLQAVRQTLFKERQKRIRPGLDNKILLDWNALMCAAFARAYAALEDPIYRDIAERNISFLLNRLKKPDGKGFFHTYATTSDGGRAHIDAFLDDYANLLHALFEVYAITFNPFYLRHAANILDYVLPSFYDTQSGLFFFTSELQQDLVVRKKELMDSATPSGNAMMLHNLLRASVFFGKPEYKALALRMAQNMQEAVQKYPSSFSQWASGLTALAYPAFEVAITGAEAGEWAHFLNRHYLPNHTLLVAEQPTLEFPLLAGRGNKNQSFIYICTDFTCQTPLTNPEHALEVLRQLHIND